MSSATLHGSAAGQGMVWVRAQGSVFTPDIGGGMWSSMQGCKQGQAVTIKLNEPSLTQWDSVMQWGRV